VNVILHILAVLAVYAALRRLRVPRAGGSAWRPPAELTALLFALHPLVSTSVLWVSEQKNTLSLVFYALSAGCFFTWLESGEPVADSSPARRPFLPWLCALAAYTLALLAKPSGIGLPLFFAFLMAMRREKPLRGVEAIIPFLAVAGLLALGTIWFQHYHSMMAGGPRPDPWSVRLVAVGWNIGFYFFKLLWPADISMVYSPFTPDPSRVVAWLPDLALVAAFWLAWRFRARCGPMPFLALSWMFLMLAPVLGFVNMSYLKFTRVADHFAYLAAVGILGLYAAAVEAVLRSSWGRIAVGALLAVALIVLDHGRCAALRSSEACWSDVMARHPDAWVAYADLGHVMNEKGEANEAARLFGTLVEMRPDDATARANYGLALLNANHVLDAARELRLALEYDPGNVNAHNNLGVAYVRLNRMEDARREFERAVKLDPAMQEAQFSLGDVLLERQRYADALPHLAMAQQLGPDDPRTLNAIARCLAGLGRLEDGLKVATRLVALHPQDMRGWTTLANLRLQDGKEELAREAYEHALHCASDEAEAVNDVGLLAARFHDTPTALAWYRRAARMVPDYAMAINNVAWVLSTATDPALRNGGAALPLAERAVELTGGGEPLMLDTRAAVAAELGQFDDAVRIDRDALRRAEEFHDAGQVAEIRRHLAAFEQRRPWRE
jgi:tetratricopeptide (TPR) repeat protein